MGDADGKPASLGPTRTEESKLTYIPFRPLAGLRLIHSLIHNSSSQAAQRAFTEAPME